MIDIVAANIVAIIIFTAKISTSDRITEPLVLVTHFFFKLLSAAFHLHALIIFLHLNLCSLSCGIGIIPAGVISHLIHCLAQYFWPGLKRYQSLDSPHL